MNIAPIIAGKQNQILRRFREAEATKAEHARSAQELGLRQNLVFRGLAARGILVATTQGGETKFHLDSASADSFVAGRRRTVLSALLIVVAAIFVIPLTR